MSRLCTLSLLLISPLALACGENSSDPAPGADASVNDPGLAPPPDGEGVQLRFDASTPAGGETTHCRYFVIPEGQEVTRFEHEIGAGGHHLIVYRTALDAADVTDEVFECGPIAGPLTYASQLEREEFALPDGVGMKFSAGEVVQVEVHRVNATDAAQENEARLNLWFADEPLPAEAGSLFMYHRDIAIAPGETATARMHCEIPEDIEVHFLTPHTHTHATRFRVWVSGEGEESELVLDGNGYVDRDTRAFAPALSVRAGQSLDFECDYENNTGDWIVEGPSGVDNEMCLLLGQYHPRMTELAEFCTMAGSGPVHDGNLSCGEVLGCAAGAGQDQVTAERCFVDVCAGASEELATMTNCGFNNCQEACPGPECFSCVLQRCEPEVGACQASSCE